MRSLQNGQPDFAAIVTSCAGTSGKEVQNSGLSPLGILRWLSAIWGRQFFQCPAFALDAYLQVHAGGLDVCVTEPVLDHFDVVAGFDEMKGRGVPECVGGDMSVLQ